MTAIDAARRLLAELGLDEPTPEHVATVATLIDSAVTNMQTLELIKTALESHKALFTKIAESNGKICDALAQLQLRVVALEMRATGRAGAA